MNSFSWWIFGYQKFCEPIIRGCISKDRGWSDITDAVLTPTIEEIRNGVYRRDDWIGDLEQLRNAAIKNLRRRQRRMKLDSAFLHEDSIVIGEFKSWGAFHIFTGTEITQKIRAGELFPERLAIDTVTYSNRQENVSRFVIATVLTDPQAPDETVMLGTLPVEIINIPRILHEHGENVAANLDSFTELDTAISMVREFVKHGGLPPQ